MYKTHTCGELRASHVGQVVTLAGWVHRRRDHGGVIFFDLRDRYGLVQITMNPTLSRETLDVIADVRFEWVLQITGKVTKRPVGMENLKMETGEVEVIATEVKVLNPAKTLPFMVSGEEQEADENTRLKYRYLDLRRELVDEPPLALAHDRRIGTKVERGELIAERNERRRDVRFHEWIIVVDENSGERAARGRYRARFIPAEDITFGKRQ